MTLFGQAFQVRNLKLRARKIEKNVIGRLTAADIGLLAVEARELRDKGLARLVALLRLDSHKKVLLGHKRVDFALTLDEKPQRDGLHAPRAQGPVVRAGDIFPQQRRNLVTDQPVENAAGLLGVDARHIDIARFGNRLKNRGLCDFVICHAPERLIAGDRG